MLNAHAKEQVAQILGIELRVAGPWADCVRSVVRRPNGTFEYAPDPNHPEYRIPCPSFETPSEKSRMEDYVARNWDDCPHRPNHGCSESYHFADVAIQHDDYERAYAGTGDHDIVAAINAAILVLIDKPAPAPFSVSDKKEALLLLAHFVGDLSRPLHVGAVYLNSSGDLINPDSPGPLDPATETVGGNAIKDEQTDLHTEWDIIPSDLGRSADSAMVEKARAVPLTAAPLPNLAAIWASESVMASHAAFAGLTFTGAGPQKWLVHFSDHALYLQSQDALQREQIAKGGAHLAQLLNAIWPPCLSGAC